MAKRKPTPTSQLDMFGALIKTDDPAPARAPVIIEVPTAALRRHRAAAKPANDAPPVQTQPILENEADMASVHPTQDLVPATPPPANEPRRSTIPCSSTWVDEEWWTLAMVCAYLKLGRKAIWERKRHPKLGFPQPVRHGSSRPRWRGQDIRSWAGAQTEL